ncbi:MAG: hypothetical protein JRI68_20215 [Deltaproteobacteria bacterium]|nr:hypothetical protein [Deltaproteobacteria bacterium]
MSWGFVRVSLILAVGITPIVVPLACSDDSDGDTSSSSTSTGTGGAGASSGVGGSGATSTGTAGGGATASGGGTWPAACQGHIYQCGDGIDNDDDGLTDWEDPDCLGPCDNTEDSYYGGIPGQNAAPCKADCYFDQDTGSGNDDCYWDHKCDDNEVADTYYPEPEEGDSCAHDEDANISGTSSSCAELQAEQSDDCLDFCLPLTPNGCDCFGCCELPAGSDNFIYLGSVGADESTVCTEDQALNPAICHPCEVVNSCWNDCGYCELCLGKTTLPPECFDPDGGSGTGGAGGGGSQCPPELQPCGLPGQDPCPPNEYCITGCCIELPT